MKGIQGCGLGLRREFLFDALASQNSPAWWEITPENWMHMPYAYREAFETIASTKPLVAHGLSLSIGSPDPLDITYLLNLKAFLDRYGITHYSEHLSFSSLHGRQTYELLPLPMTLSMATHVANKLKKVQDFLGRAVILENATYYHVPYSEMREIDFLLTVLERSGAKMLLDINNVYVNATNHHFDAKRFIDAIDSHHVAYMHVAGHTLYEEENLIIDTHGESIIDDVWALVAHTCKRIDAPIMIERDNDVPSWEEMKEEFTTLHTIVKGARGA
ncbi:MAG: hypothetical protein KU37_02750 [Sulfuricurvum sp. PC08-66]|nr:MAG: hypothetical protein KU37_02750 [Sulfuricurvum sp. PC08-66]